MILLPIIFQVFYLFYAGYIFFMWFFLLGTNRHTDDVDNVGELAHKRFVEIVSRGGTR